MITVGVPGLRCILVSLLVVYSRSCVSPGASWSYRLVRQVVGFLDPSLLMSSIMKSKSAQMSVVRVISIPACSQ